MTNLLDLHRAVQSTLASKRLGTPVFVRYTLQSQDKPSAAVNRLAQLTAIVRDWIGQALERVYAVGTAKAGHLSLTLEFAGGATAQISWTGGGQRTTGVDLMLVGNHGALYHDAGAANLWEEPLAALEEKPDQRLVTLIERAMQSARPVAAGK